MNNIETLKLELLKQKEAIEDLGGYVNIANNNPSPSEITEGIRTVIGNLDLTLATATEGDVTSGKTFYAGDNKLKTGIKQGDTFYRMYLYGDCTAESISTPTDITSYRSFMFAGVKYNSSFIIPNCVESIGNSAFKSASLGSVEFEDNSGLKEINDEAFHTADVSINLSRLPDTIEKLGHRPFYNATATSDGYLKIPRNLTTVGQYSLSTYNYFEHTEGLDWNNNTSLTATYQSMFYNQSFSGELTFPPTITKLANSTFYCCRYHKVTFPATILNMDSNAYCISSSYFPKVPKLDIIFEAETPPKFNGCPFYYLTFIENLSIYVPDSSYEVYKADNNLSTYVNYIKRMSELPE